MYLTRFQINTARRGARKLLASPQTLHAAVLAAFPRPEDHTGDDARTLWRLDSNPHNQMLLYILSPGRPDLTHLVEQAGWPTTETWQTRPYGALLDGLDKDQKWAFRLTANPTRNGRSPRRPADTQRFGAVTVEHQTQWLIERAERNGFAVNRQRDDELNLVIHQRRTLTFRRNGGDRPVTLVTATYDGVLTVDDPAVFRRTLVRGIGHARAYGCGLLTLAPLGAGR